MKKIIFLACFYWGLIGSISHAQNAWPGEAWASSINLTSLDANFNINTSGQFWNPLKRELWIVNNSGYFWRLKEGGGLGMMIDNTGGTAKWAPGGDLEDITQANLYDNTVFIMNEGGYIQEYNVSVPGTVNNIHTWDVRTEAGPNAGSGPEGLTFVPDEWLSYNGFVDQNGNPYTSVNGMGGLMFVAHQTGGYIYVFDLKRSDNTYIYVGKYETGYAESSGLAFDRSIGKLFIWHNTGSNYIEVSQMRSYDLGGGIRKFYMQASFFGPKTGNLEGIGFTPASSGENWYFATDDDNQDGYAVYWFQSFNPCVFEPFFETNKTSACIGETITFTDTTIGLCGAETFLWDFGANASPATATGQGPHTISYSSTGAKNIKLKVSGLFADSLQKNSYITINSLPGINISGNTTICQGRNTTMTASGGATYLWSSNATTTAITVSPSSTASYTVTGTDANSCSNIATTTITVNSLPIVTANPGATTLCAGTSITLTGGGATSYVWTGGATDGAGFIPTSSSSYIVTGTDVNSCTNTATTSITVNPLPTVTLGPDKSICAGQTTTLDAGPGFASYQWTSADSTWITQGSVWKYLDNGADQGTTWTNPGFNDSGWPSGIAELGYGDGGEATLVSFGSDPNNKFITTYFRKNFNVADPLDFSDVKLRLMRDDGAVVYLNGTEVHRANMPGGVVTYTTLANATVGAPDESTFFETTIGTAGLVSGQNVVAVEIHQVNGTSSDISFDLELVGIGAIANQQTISAAAGTYQIVITDANSCTAKDTVTVIENNLPAVSITGTATICNGTSATLTAMGAISYVWSPSGTTTTVTVSPTSTTPYTVTGTDANSCSNTATTTITVISSPTVTAGASATNLCAGAGTSVTLTGGGAVSYSWSSGITDGVGFVPSATTSYTVTGTGANSCTHTASIAVNVNSIPIVTANTSTTNVCAGAGTSVTLTGGGAVSYSWSGGIINGVGFTPTSTVSYTVTGTDANSCSGTAITTVTVNSLPSISANASASTLCAGSLVTLTGGGAISYAWTGGVTNGISFAPSSTSFYTVTGTDANNCSNTASTSVTVNPLPGITTTLTGSVITANQSGAAYQWLDCNNGNSPIPGATNQNYTATTNGNYAVVITLNGCSDTSSCVSISVVGISQPVLSVVEGGVRLYPNPNNGSFTIQSAEPGVYSILNELGQNIQTIELNTANSYTRHIEDLNNGLYFIVGSGNGAISKQKVMVIK